MNSFFETLNNLGELTSCAKYFDWLFDEARFDNYSQADLSKITTTVHKLLEKSNVKYLPLSKIHMIGYTPNSKSEKVFVFYTNKSARKDFYKHIRNGIAHGHASVTTKNKELYITLVDYFDPVKREKRSSYTNISLNLFISILQYGLNKGIK